MIQVDRQGTRDERLGLAGSSIAKLCGVVWRVQREARDRVEITSDADWQSRRRNGCSVTGENANSF